MSSRIKRTNVSFVRDPASALPSNMPVARTHAKSMAQAMLFVSGPPERNTPRTFHTPASLKKLLNVIVNHVATPEELGEGAKYFQ